MKTQIGIAIVLLAIGQGAISCKKDNKEANEQVPTISVAAVERDTVLLSKSYPGVLSAVNMVDVVARVNGSILSQEYNSGDNLKKGQVMFRIDPTLYRDQLQQAEAALATARSQYEYNSRNYAAMKKALESDAVSQMEVLQSKSAMETAQADIKRCEAAVETARTNLGYCTVTAPIAGTTTKAAFAPGAYVSGAGAPVTLTSLYDNSELNANFNIEDATYIRAFIDAGKQDRIPELDYENVPLTFSEKLDKQYTGRLSYISPSVDTGTGTLALRVRVQNPDGELRDGMYASINLPYQLDPDAILVKDASIMSSQSKKYIYVVNDSNRVVYTPIEVGEMANDSMRIVASGLKGNERYVTRALLKVRPGMEVDPKVEK